MGENVKPVILNIGCGFRKMPEAVNVDGYEICEPDVLWDLNKYPWPWEDESVDIVFAFHVMEHMDDWLKAFKEVARILKVGGMFDMRVPDATSTDDMGYIDHKFTFTRHSFHMCIKQHNRGANAWARSQGVIPLAMTRYQKVILDKYVKWWIPKWFLKFASEHMTNFVHEQRFEFIKY